MQTPETTPIKGLTKAGETVWYTGRAGHTGTSTSWLSFDRAEAFLLSVEGARRKAADLNRMTDIHGIHFIAVVGDEPLVQIPSNAKLIDHNGNGRVFCDGRKHYLLPRQHGTPVRIDGDCYGGRDCEGDGIAWVRGKQAVAPKNASGPMLEGLRNIANMAGTSGDAAIEEIALKLIKLAEGGRS